MSNAAYVFDSLGSLAGPKRRILAQYGKGDVVDVRLVSLVGSIGY